MEFLGYERPDGSAGVRNYVAIIPSTSCANELACEIAHGVAGTVPVLHNHGCLRLQPDNDLAFTTLAGLGHNPNVAATLLLGIGCDNPTIEAMAQEISAAGTPVEVIIVKDAGGYQKAIQAGRAAARGMVSKASLQQRVPVPLGKLSVGIKCGGSATISSAAGHPVTGHVVDAIVDAGGTAIFSETPEVIGAEHILAKRAASEQVRKDLLKAVCDFEQTIIDYGVDVRGAQPTAGNIMSGLTTLEEKSLAALVKTGTRPLAGVLKYGQRPPGPGLYFLDSPAWPVYLFLGMAAVGAQLFIFSLGGGVCALFPSQPGALRLPVVPTIKVSGDPSLKDEPGYLDFYAGTILEGSESKQAAGERFLKAVIDIASGAPTQQEFSRYREVLDIYATGPMM